MEEEEGSLKKKVVLLGNSAVGKTSIFNRLTMNRYFEDGVTTTSAYFKSIQCDVDQKPVTINLWDTAGQEKFMSLTEMYVRDSAGVVIVYDITSK